MSSRGLNTSDNTLDGRLAMDFGSPLPGRISSNWRGPVTPESPIVVLDSGLGGLTVVRALQAALPAERIIYFGDMARLPYGSKSAATVTSFTRQIIHYLRPYQAKHVVVACNTATALALPSLKSHFPGLSISGVIEPGAKAAVVAAGAKIGPVIGVIATEATVRSGAYEQAIFRRRHRATVVQKAAPLLVPIVEEGRRGDDPVVQWTLKGYLTPLVTRGINVLVLGCTHYPILQPTIEQMVGTRVTVIDSAQQSAQDVARRLRDRQLLRGSDGSSGWKAQGDLRCIVTDDPGRFRALGSRFLGVPMEAPAWVTVEELESAGESMIIPQLHVEPPRLGDVIDTAVASLRASA